MNRAARPQRMVLHRCACLVVALSAAPAAELYVSIQGSDSNPGTAAQPFRTITNAYSHAVAGTTIIVLPGTYTDYTSRWGLHLNRSGTAANPITLRSQIRGGAILDGQNASDRHEGVYLDGSYNVLDGFEICHAPDGGITIYGNSNRILNCEIHHNGNMTSPPFRYGKGGIYSNQTTAGSYYANNSVHDNGRTGNSLDHGFYLCGKNETVINNLLFRHPCHGLLLAGYTVVSNFCVYNNVMAWNGGGGIMLWSNLSRIDIKNDIFYHNVRHGIDSSDAHGSGVVVDHNLCWSNTQGDFAFTLDHSDFSYILGTNFSADPLFADGSSASFDAHLGAGSPALGVGTNLFSVFTTDLTGAPRPAAGPWDLGAYAATLSQPRLQIALVGSQVQLSWPIGDATVYVLQSDPFLSGASTWTDVPTPPAIIGTQNVVTTPATAAATWYRLRSQ